jgi:hypothetical protein
VKPTIFKVDYRGSISLIQEDTETLLRTIQIVGMYKINPSRGLQVLYSPSHHLFPGRVEHLKHAFWLKDTGEVLDESRK